ncbi:hypothetical protein [Methylobacterium sp. Leaf456]|uniref:hypothetical protein n=1 Tax=Methylobacterium sp. Leaf456 TaxID=1736382 RepID=UPI000A4F5462|nr:hypothetical protein [Methylobacterium sp. Leaf456]
MLFVQDRNSIEIISSNPFRYVYDCGSKKLADCEQAIEVFLNECHSKKLDLLFLSHFDNDHVNGVPALLDKRGGLHVNTVVMPWVDDVERMIVWGKTAASRASSSDFFSALVIDPEGALEPFDPAQIIFVRAADDDGPEAGVVDVGPLDPGGEGPFRAKVASIGRDGSRRPPNGRAKYSGRTQVLIVDSRSAIEVSAGAGFSWLLKPYVRRTDPVIVAKFERAAERELGWDYGTFRNRVSDRAVRADLVRDVKKSAALAAAYKSAVGNRNLTSLCLYSGPNTTDEGPVPMMVRLGPDRRGLATRIGWLGSGDISLAAPADGQAFLDHYATELTAITSFGLPHHGAKPNHSKHVLSVINPSICYASAKPPKNWKHPHPDVFADAQSIGAHTMKVSDQERTTFGEAFAIVG